MKKMYWKCQILNTLPSNPEKAEENFSIRYHFIREYLEELFNRPQLKGDGNIFHDPCSQKLMDYMNNKDISFFFTGIAINLFNLRPEICTLLYIRTPDWFEYNSMKAPIGERFFGNEEFKNSGYAKSDCPFGFHIRYNNQDTELVSNGRLYPDRMVPSGAAAFWLGIDVLRSIL